MVYIPNWMITHVAGYVYVPLVFVNGDLNPVVYEPFEVDGIHYHEPGREDTWRVAERPTAECNAFYSIKSDRRNSVSRMAFGDERLKDPWDTVRDILAKFDVKPDEKVESFP